MTILWNRPLAMGGMLALALASFAAGGPPAQALDLNSRQWADTGNPFTDVGNRSAELSKLCRLGRFNQKRIAETYIRFDGEKGRGLLGIAKMNYNLFDPLDKAEPDKTYHFYADGTSACKVFVAP